MKCILGSRSRFLLALAICCWSLWNPLLCEDLSTAQIAGKIRGRVQQQISSSSNYACVETIERTYYRIVSRSPLACDLSEQSAAENQFVNDRLRLDIAVSKGGEIFSWHGENKFSTGTLSQLVPNGVISSGNFVGFIQNIFLNSGTRFTLKGTANEHGQETYRLAYAVPIAASSFRITGRKKSGAVPFHGMIYADARTFDLRRLTIVADKIASGLDMCDVDNEVKFNTVAISGKLTLIPSEFNLQTFSDERVHAVSRGEYHSCREFHTESKIRFDVDAAALAKEQANIQEAWLPAGMDLPIALKTVVDEKTAYAGDAVEGRLLIDENVPSLGLTLPRDTTVYGRITQLESHEEGGRYFLYRLVFDHADLQGRTIRFKAVHKPSATDLKAVQSWERSGASFSVKSSVQDGSVLMRAGYLHLDGHLTGHWLTQSPSG